MEVQIIIFALAVFYIGRVTSSWEYLSVKYSYVNGFFDVPLTTKDIDQENYVFMARDDEMNVNLYSYPGDPRVSLMFDSYGNIAGIRTAYIKKDVGIKAKSKNMKFPYTYDDKPMYTSGNYYGIDLWYTSVLFISPEKLLKGGRPNRNGKVAEEIYMKLDGTWTQIPKDECQAKDIGFTKQSCFIGMGMHYFYKVTPSIDCNDHQGAFLLYEKEELIGLGFNPFGSFTKKDRQWFEEVPPNVVKSIVSWGPKCLKSWVKNYGSTAFHIFFKRRPRLTFCKLPFQKSSSCASSRSTRPSR